MVRTDGALKRRQLLQLGGLGGLAMLFATPGGASASGSVVPPEVTIQDLGAGINNFTMMASVISGDTVYLATRNVEPMKVVGFHLPTRTVTSVTDTLGETTQAMAVDPSGRYIYICARVKGIDSKLFRIDLSTPNKTMEILADVVDLEPFTMTISPDGVVFMGGRESGPKVRQYDPATGVLSTLALPDPAAQYGRSLIATETTVYFGLRARNPETGAAAAGFYSIDRATGVAKNILPPELAKTSEIRDIIRVGGQLVLVNGSIGAIMDLADTSSYKLLRAPLNMGKLPCELNGKIYFAGSAGIAEYDPATNKYQSVIDPSNELGAVWGLFAYNGKLQIVSAFGLIMELDPETQKSSVYDLLQLGAPVSAQLAMSIAYGDGSVYVGGTNAIAKHDLATGEVRNIIGTDEAKDMVMVNGVLYTAQYSGKGIMAYDPADEAKGLHLLAPLPDNQNRPHDVLWDAERERLYFGSGSDAKVYGALTVFNPATATIESFHPNPFGDNQQIRTIARQGSTLFLGGEAEGRSQVMAWDLTTSQELWRVSFATGPDAICGLVVHDDLVYALGYRGWLNVIAIASRSVVSSALYPSLMPNWGSLNVIDGNVYGVSSSSVFRIDPTSHEAQALVEGLAADWYGVPRMAAGADGEVYAIKGRQLVRIHGIGTSEPDYVEAHVRTRCLGRKVSVETTVRNLDSKPRTITVESIFGARTFHNVQPGKSASHGFNTHQEVVTAGQVRVRSHRTWRNDAAAESFVYYGTESCLS